MSVYTDGEKGAYYKRENMTETLFYFDMKKTQNILQSSHSLLYDQCIF